MANKTILPTELMVPSTKLRRKSNTIHNHFSHSILQAPKCEKIGRRKTTITVAAIASFCLNLGLLIFLSLHHPKNNFSKELQFPSRTQKGEWLKKSLCFECRIIGLLSNQMLSSNLFWQLQLRDEQLCCFPEAESLRRLLDVFNMQTMMKQPDGEKNAVGLSLPSAHLYLDSLEDNNYKWSNEFGFGAAHVTKPIEFRGGRYVIRKSAFYCVYSFITLKRRTESSDVETIGHRVIRIGSNKGVILQDTVDLPRHSETFTTSYISGIVKLNYNDQLYVDVSDVEAVYRFAPSNFFGLYQVQEI